jgi:hypothetical protein
LAAIIACSAHADSDVRVEKANVDLGICQTFAWHAQSQEPASFADQRVQAAAMATLEAKGYTVVPENPDCRVSYVFSSHETQGRSRPRIGVGVGSGAGGIGGGIGIGLPIGRKKQSGTLAIDIIDAARNAQIWGGSLEVTLKSAELTEAEVSDWVSKVLAEFPDRGAKPSQ